MTKFCGFLGGVWFGGHEVLYFFAAARGASDRKQRHELVPDATIPEEEDAEQR